MENGESSYFFLLSGKHYLHRTRSGSGVHYFCPHPPGQNSTPQSQTCKGAWEMSSSVPGKGKITVSKSHAHYHIHQGLEVFQKTTMTGTFGILCPELPTCRAHWLQSLNALLRMWLIKIFGNTNFTASGLYVFVVCWKFGPLRISLLFLPAHSMTFF